MHLPGFIYKYTGIGRNAEVDVLSATVTEYHLPDVLFVYIDCQHNTSSEYKESEDQSAFLYNDI